jgi:hypothetical protein
MRPKTFDIDPADENLTGYLSNATGTGPWTMAVTNSGDGLAHKVSIRNDAAVDYRGQTFTLVGTDADGRPQTNTITGPDASLTVESTKYFKTLLTSTASGAGISTDTFDYGWVDEIASQTIPLDPYLSAPPTIDADLTGTANFDIQISTRNPWDTDVVDQEALAFVDDANWSGETADSLDDLSLPGLRSMRFTTNSYSSGAEIQFYCTFPGHTS